MPDVGLLAWENYLARPLLPAEIDQEADVHYNYTLDSLYENDMLESVPVAPGEQSLCEQAVAAARALRALELSHKCKQTAVPCP